MASFLDTLFGGGSQQQSSRSKSLSKTSSLGVTGSNAANQAASVSQTSDYQNPALSAVASGPFATSLSGLLGSGGLSGIPSFGQPLVAPITGTETKDLAGLNTAATDPSRQSYLNDVLGGKYLPGGSASNPFLAATIEAAQRPTLQGLEETLSRALPGRFALAGQNPGAGGSSAFDRAAAIATRGTAQTLGDIATNISFGAQEAERGRQQQAVQLGQQEVQSLVTNLQAQALPRLIQDLGVERGLGEFQTRLQTLLSVLGITASGAAPVLGQNAASTSAGTSQSVGLDVSKGRATSSSRSSGTGSQTGGIIPGLTSGFANVFGSLFPPQPTGL